MTSDLEQSRYDRLIRRLGNMTGPGARVAEVLTELFPTIDVELVPPELLILMGTNICVGAASVAGDAGEAPRLQLFNPVDSANIITVTQVLATPSVIAVIRIGRSDAELPTPIDTQTFMDSRLAVTSRPVGRISSDSSAALVDANIQFVVEANVTVPIRDRNSVAVLAPGTGLEVGDNANASTLRVTFFWRERPAEPSELQF